MVKRRAEMGLRLAFFGSMASSSASSMSLIIKAKQKARKLVKMMRGAFQRIRGETRADKDKPRAETKMTVPKYSFQRVSWARLVSSAGI